MPVWYILMNSAALVFGSLIGATLLTCLIGWVGQRSMLARRAPIVQLAIVGGICVTPLSESLFVRMLLIFSVVGAGILYFSEPGKETTADREL